MWGTLRPQGNRECRPPLWPALARGSTERQPRGPTQAESSRPHFSVTAETEIRRGYPWRPALLVNDVVVGWRDPGSQPQLRAAGQVGQRWRVHDEVERRRTAGRDDRLESPANVWECGTIYRRSERKELLDARIPGSHRREPIPHRWRPRADRPARLGAGSRRARRADDLLDPGCVPRRGRPGRPLRRAH